MGTPTLLEHSEPGRVGKLDPTYRQMMNRWKDRERENEKMQFACFFK